MGTERSARTADIILAPDPEHKQGRRGSDDVGSKKMLYQGYFGSAKARSPRVEISEAASQHKREASKNQNRPRKREDVKEGEQEVMLVPPAVGAKKKGNNRKKKAESFWSKAGTGPIRGDKLAENDLHPDTYEEKKASVTVLHPSSSSSCSSAASSSSLSSSAPYYSSSTILSHSSAPHISSSSDRIVTTTTLSLQTRYPVVTSQSNTQLSQPAPQSAPQSTPQSSLQTGGKKQRQKKGEPPPANQPPLQSSQPPLPPASTVTTLQPHRAPIVSLDQTSLAPNQIPPQTSQPPLVSPDPLKHDGRKQGKNQKQQRNNNNKPVVVSTLPSTMLVTPSITSSHGQQSHSTVVLSVQLPPATLPVTFQSQEKHSNKPVTQQPQERKSEKQEQNKSTPKQQRPQKQTRPTDIQPGEVKTTPQQRSRQQPKNQPGSRPTNPNQQANWNNNPNFPQRGTPKPHHKAEFQKDFVFNSSFQEPRLTNAEVRQRQAQASSIYSRKLPTAQTPSISNYKSSSLNSSPETQPQQPPEPEEPQQRRPRQQKQQSQKQPQPHPKQSQAQPKQPQLQPERQQQRHQQQQPQEEPEQPARSAPPPRFSSRELWQANRPTPKQEFNQRVQPERKQRQDSNVPSSQTSSRSRSPSSESSHSRSPSRSRSRSVSSREESPASSRSGSPDSRSSSRGRGRRRRRGSREGNVSQSPEKTTSESELKKDQSGHDRKEAATGSRREAKTASSFSVAQTTSLIKDYVMKFASKVQREMEEEKRHVLERLAKWPLERLVQEGLAIQGMRAEASGQHMGKVIVRLQWLFAVPFHRFVVGDHMVLSRVDPLKESPIHALLLDATAQEIRVLIADITPNLFTGLWRIDKGYSTIVYERIHRVLANMNLFPKGDSIPLLNIFLQPDRAFGSSTVFSSAAVTWAKDTIARLDAPSKRGKREGEDWGLHSCQQRAAANAILSRFSLIYGPPGTGKTHTLCHFIKLITSFKAPLPILACAKTNAGVDHLLELLIQLGLRVVRVGQPQREELKTYALENAIHKHPLDASVEQELKHLVALKARQKNFHAQFSRDRDLAQIAVKTQHKKVREIRSRVMKEVLADIQVVCATACGSQDEELEGVRFPVVVIDDASQLSEPETLLVVHRASHAVLAGGRVLNVLFICLKKRYRKDEDFW